MRTSKANYIALKFGHIQYRFWNFSILSKGEIDNEKLSVIRNHSINFLKTKQRGILKIISRQYLESEINEFNCSNGLNKNDKDSIAPQTIPQMIEFCFATHNLNPPISPLIK